MEQLIIEPPQNAAEAMGSPSCTLYLSNLVGVGKVNDLVANGSTT